MGFLQSKNVPVLCPLLTVILLAGTNVANAPGLADTTYPDDSSSPLGLLRDAGELAYGLGANVLLPIWYGPYDGLKRITPTPRDWALLTYYDGVTRELIRLGDAYWQGGQTAVDSSLPSYAAAPGANVSGIGNHGDLRVVGPDGNVHAFPGRWPEVREGLVQSLAYNYFGFGGISLTPDTSHNIPWYPGVSIAEEVFRTKGPASANARNEIGEIAHESLHTIGNGRFALGVGHSHIAGVFAGVDEISDNNNAFDMLVEFLANVRVQSSTPNNTVWKWLTHVRIPDVPAGQ